MQRGVVWPYGGCALTILREEKNLMDLIITWTTLPSFRHQKKFEIREAIRCITAMVNVLSPICSPPPSPCNCGHSNWGYFSQMCETVIRDNLHKCINNHILGKFTSCWVQRWLFGQVDDFWGYFWLREKCCNIRRPHFLSHTALTVIHAKCLVSSSPPPPSLELLRG